MRIAIPIHQQRISPVFDVASQMLVVEPGAGESPVTRQVELHSPSELGRVRELSDLGIQVLICGALSRWLEEAIIAAGIEVYSRRCGPAEAIVQAYMAGTLESDTFLMPGCRGRGRRQGGGGGRGRCGGLRRGGGGGRGGQGRGATRRR